MLSFLFFSPQGMSVLWLFHLHLLLSFYSFSKCVLCSFVFYFSNFLKIIFINLFSLVSGLLLLFIQCSFHFASGFRTSFNFIYLCLWGALSTCLIYFLLFKKAFTTCGKKQAKPHCFENMGKTSCKAVNIKICSQRTQNKWSVKLFRQSYAVVNGMKYGKAVIHLQGKRCFFLQLDKFFCTQ